MTPLFAGILHGFGLPVVAGGAGRFLAAFRSLLDSLAVRVETTVDVDRILVARGRAVGVASTGIACAEAEAGLLPRRPTVVVGQQYLLDPARVPAGAAALWLQLQEVPCAPRGDAAGELDTTHGWTEALATGYAHRVLDRVAQHVPDLRDKIRAIDVLTPDDLRDRNPNAVSGDPYGGSAELDQTLLWRPLASSGRHATPVGRLWHIGASTHPGAGLGGGSGHLVATTLTRRRAWRR